MSDNGIGKYGFTYKDRQQKKDCNTNRVEQFPEQ